MSAREAPVILGRICRSWRIISQSFPPLWSSLHIVEPRCPYLAPAGLSQAKISQRQEVAIAWLQRSGTCPLSISLECALDDGIDAEVLPGSVMNADHFLHLLIPFAPRWQEITLSVPSLALKTLSCLTENDVPLLKDLAIAERLESANDNTLLSLSPVLHAPSLSRFSLSGSNVHYSDLPLPLSHLTALTLVGVEQWRAENAQSCQIILGILYNCSQLRTCTLRVNEPPGEYLQDSVVECPFLHTLNLLCTSSVLYTSGRLLSRLSVPVLQDFKIYGDWRVDQPSEAYNVSGGDSLWAFLATCTRLKYITTDNATFSKYRLMDFFRNLPPTIQRFHTVPTGYISQWHRSQITIDDDVFAAFEASPDPILPALEELTVDDGYFVVSDEVLLRFIVSRIPTLQRVDIAVAREKQVDILPALQPFVDAGLKISVTYFAPRPLPFSPWQGLLLSGSPSALCGDQKPEQFVFR